MGVPPAPAAPCGECGTTAVTSWRGWLGHIVPEAGELERPRGAGRKDDSAKLRFELLPLESLAPIVRVLAFGAEKYGVDNWRKVPEFERRYFAAAMRHLVAHQLGERLDPESGESHLAHAACCLLFLVSIATAQPRGPSGEDKGSTRRAEGAEALLDTLGGRP